jgi:NADPH2:quinone reductase
MKAILIYQRGGPEALQLQETELPAPGQGRVLIKIKAAGVNFVDIYERRGDHPVALPLPYTPGREGAGVVDAVGEGVESVRPGDRIAYSSTEPGSYAEYSLVPASHLIPLPDDLSFEQGASFPFQGLTAHFLLHDYRPVRPGDTVLIHAAAGGVGLLLVQWAKRLGARVIGTVSTEAKAQAAREAGADHVVLYTRQDFVAETRRLTGGQGADLILDSVGKTTFAGDLEAAATFGNIVLYGLASGPPDPIAPISLLPRSLTISGGDFQSHIARRETLLRRANAVLDGIRAGWLRLRLSDVLPLAQAAEAHRLLENRQSMGKIVLTIDS